MPEETSEGAQGRPVIPPTLPILPLRDAVAFPEMVIPLVVGRPKSMKLIDDILVKDRLLAMVAQKRSETEDPGEVDIRRFGTAGVVLKMFKFPDGTTRILVQGLARIEVTAVLRTDPYITAEITELPDVLQESTELKALTGNVSQQFQSLLSFTPNAPDELKVTAMNISDPGRLADFVASNMNLATEERQRILETVDVRERLIKVSAYLSRELEVAELGKKIQTQVHQRLEKNQREFYLREQLKAIQKELGEEDEKESHLREMRGKVKEAGLPEEAKKEAEKELSRLERMSSMAAEYSVVLTYLDWLTSLPWRNKTEDNLDIDRVKAILDRDHWDLQKVKERILEFVAVRKLKPEGKGPILCFVGPPGTGKTSLGRSIASALGRKFRRMSLGGVRDEAEIRGHRRTYVGALPGKIIQAIARVESMNPLIMLDEVDKLGVDFRGDPASALLEVLDPEQNHAFVDHYLGVPFDLSHVIFIVTANILDTVPPALRDRLEVLYLPGYSEEEKAEIALRHLVPGQLDANGLKKENLTIKRDAIRTIVREYTREAGVRNLEREIANVCRKVAVKVISGKKPGKAVVGSKALRKLLGPPKRYVETSERLSIPGVAVGLAWTPTGGEILYVEATKMPGKGRLIVTGHLGEVMQESVKTALSVVRTRSKALNITDDDFDKIDLHVHVPEGAIPKDGPSAGAAMVTSLVSILTGKTARSDLALTGEITLRGKLLPGGGIREKVLAAVRAGIKKVVLPEWNKNDLEEVPPEHLKGLKVILAKNVDDALRAALPQSAFKKRR